MMNTKRRSSLYGSAIAAGGIISLLCLSRLLRPIRATILAVSSAPCGVSLPTICSSHALPITKVSFVGRHVARGNHNGFAAIVTCDINSGALELIPASLRTEPLSLVCRLRPEPYSTLFAAYFRRKRSHPRLVAFRRTEAMFLPGCLGRCSLDSSSAPIACYGHFPGSLISSARTAAAANEAIVGFELYSAVWACLYHAKSITHCIKGGKSNEV